MRLISRGQTCEVAFRIRMHTAKTDAVYFDWLRTPFDALVRTIDSNFTNKMTPADFDILEEDPRFLRNFRTGIDYGHVFLKDARGAFPANWRDDLGRVDDIFRTLKRK